MHALKKIHSPRGQSVAKCENMKKYSQMSFCSEGIAAKELSPFLCICTCYFARLLFIPRVRSTRRISVTKS